MAHPLQGMVGWSKVQLSHNAIGSKSSVQALQRSSYPHSSSCILFSNAAFKPVVPGDTAACPKLCNMPLQVEDFFVPTGLAVLHPPVLSILLAMFMVSPAHSKQGKGILENAFMPTQSLTISQYLSGQDANHFESALER